MSRAKYLDKDYLGKYVYYDSSSKTGLRLKLDGSVAGKLDTSGYYRVSIENKKYLVHRIIFSLLSKENIMTFEIDHVDGNKLNNNFDNLRAVTASTNSRNKVNLCSRSGYPVGIHFESSKDWSSERIRAAWYDVQGKLRTKSFSINKLGIMIAFRDAVIHRQKMIEELNSQGAGYTERHGKEVA